MSDDACDKVNILIVDDNADNLTVLEAILKKPDRVVVRATSGQEALRWLLSKEMALVLLDIQMPEMDGYETATLIRNRHKTRDLPIIFVTAFGKETADLIKGYSFGAVDYIIKP